MLPVFCHSPAFCGELKFQLITSKLRTQEVARCVGTAEELSSRLGRLTAQEILNLYRSEECAVSGLYGPLSEMTERSAWVSTAAARGAGYLSANAGRFRDVSDGWKGEDNTWEPNRALLEILTKRAPESAPRWEIEWDLDYKDFIRRFTYDHSGSAKGKTCARYYDDYVKSHGEIREAYSAGEIEERKADCEADRASYKKGLEKLLKKFNDKPVLPKLYDPDETNIISDMYFGLC